MPRGILVRKGARYFEVQRGMTIILNPQSPRLCIMRRGRSQGYLDNGFPPRRHALPRYPLLTKMASKRRLQPLPARFKSFPADLNRQRQSHTNLLGRLRVNITAATKNVAPNRMLVVLPATEYAVSDRVLFAAPSRRLITKDSTPRQTNPTAKMANATRDARRVNVKPKPLISSVFKRDGSREVVSLVGKLMCRRGSAAWPNS